MVIGDVVADDVVIGDVVITVELLKVVFPLEPKKYT